MKVQFSLSDKAILAYLAQGQEKAKKQEINISPSDLSGVQLELLTETTEVIEAREGSVTVKFKTNYFTYKIGDIEFDVRLGELNSVDINDILDEIRKVIAAACEKHLEQQARLKKENEERAAAEEARKLYNEENIKLFLKGEDARFKLTSSGLYLWEGAKSKSGEYYLTEQTLIGLFPDLKADIEFEVVRRQLIEEKAADAERKEMQEKEDASRDWAVQFGSELVKARIQNGYEWKNEAEEEWLVATFPELRRWSDFDVESSDPLENPTLEQLRELEAFKAKYPSATDVTLDCVHHSDYESSTVVSGEFDGLLGSFLLLKTIN